MEVEELKREILELRKLLRKKEERLLSLMESDKNALNNNNSGVPQWAIERYSRQALLTDLGNPKDIINKLMKSSVLIVGAGGLGSPAAIYLAGAGIGHIGIVDYDDVELTNLHRQPLHSELTVGMSKVESAALFLRRLNSNIIITPYNLQLNSTNALEIISKYNLVIDATDNAVTRYLLNDACVLSKKPLVSAAALQMSGQFTIYNMQGYENTQSGPCYRCLFPEPPPPETMGSCSQNGVLGPVPGLMGSLQAIEAIKIILGKSSMSGRLLLYDGSDCSFTKIKLRQKDKNCAICSENPSVHKLIDYEQFCNSLASDKDLKLNILTHAERIKPQDFYHNVYSNVESPSKNNQFGSVAFIDVRSFGEYDMCRIHKSQCIPIDSIDYGVLSDSLKASNTKEVYFVCRRGNDSQTAARRLKNSWPDDCAPPLIKDIEGGLHAWGRDVDCNFPIY